MSQTADETRMSTRKRRERERVRVKGSNTIPFSVLQSARPENGVIRILDRKAAASWTKGAMRADLCGEVFQRFMGHPQCQARGDGVPALSIGVDHYGKHPTDYVREAREQVGVVHGLFRDLQNPIVDFLTSLAVRAKQRGYVVRPAVWRGSPALPFRMMAFTGKSDFLLPPHDDLSQMRARINGDWEVTGIDRDIIVAVNFYFRVPSGQGELIVWNRPPTRVEKRRLGLDQTGYPYPNKALAGRKSITLGVQTGDIVILNGAHIHAVRPAKDRLIANLFIGRIGKDLVYWT